MTAIEILSPANKVGRERKKYLKKRDQYLHGSAHLLEIDMVRQGRRVPMREALPDVPYFVFFESGQMSAIYRGMAD